MSARHRWAAALLAAVPLAPAFAGSLHEAAARALERDPRLEAAELSARASDAGVDRARAGFLPSVGASVEGGVSHLYTRAPFPRPGERQPLTWGVAASQPLYSGGALSAGLAAARARLEASQAALRDTRQQLLLAATVAWLDLKRDRDVIALSRATARTLEQALHDAQRRLAAGEATRTDVAQASARLADAQATVARAEATAAVSEAAYERSVGEPAPRTLAEDWPMPAAPASLAEAMAQGGATPAIELAEARERAARAEIDGARAGHLPKLTIEGEANDAVDSQFVSERLRYWAVQLKATLPVFEGGATEARIAEARASAAAAGAQTRDTRRAAIENISAGWSLYAASAEVIRAYEANVESANLALDSVRKELAVGTRTTLELLDAEREALAAHVNLAGSRHDRAVAALQLLAATGRLTLEAVP